MYPGQIMIWQFVIFSSHFIAIFRIVLPSSPLSHSSVCFPWFWRHSVGHWTYIYPAIDHLWPFPLPSIQSKPLSLHFLIKYAVSVSNLIMSCGAHDKKMADVPMVWREETDIILMNSVFDVDSCKDAWVWEFGSVKRRESPKCGSLMSKQSFGVHLLRYGYWSDIQIPTITSTILCSSRSTVCKFLSDQLSDSLYAEWLGCVHLITFNWMDA